MSPFSIIADSDLRRLSATPMTRGRGQRSGLDVGIARIIIDELSIVMLQEVFRGISIGNALSALTKALGAFYHISYSSAGGLPYLCEVGQATLSRFPVLRRRKYPVPSGRYRCTLFTELAAPGVRLHAYSAHIGGTAREMGEVLATANCLSEPHAMDIIMGDFNWDYLSETRNLILSEMYGFKVAGSGPTATLADNVAQRAEYREAINFTLS